MGQIMGTGFEYNEKKQKKRGRPKRLQQGTEEQVLITFKIPKKVADKLDKYAREYELQRTAIIKFAIIDKLEKLKLEEE